MEGLKKAVTDHWRQAGGIAANVVAYATRSGFALAGWAASVVLVPVVTFYTLRDWDRLVAAVHDLLPRDVEPTVSALARESDEVLGAFLRGQLTPPAQDRKSSGRGQQVDVQVVRPPRGLNLSSLAFRSLRLVDRADR